jgi:hypothetical protein
MTLSIGEETELHLDLSKISSVEAVEEKGWLMSSKMQYWKIWY